ncbi:MAG: beta strand repeat-containing protein, partial [Dolichospermum sp.]
MNLVVNYASTSISNKTICANELPYTWNGLTFNAAGSQTAHFTNAAGCDSAATLNLTVNTNPVVPAINGTKSVCINGTAPLSNTTVGGVWSSSNIGVATVDNTGLVTGLVAGTSTISYTVTNVNNCSTSSDVVITVNALPTVDTITGSNQVCLTSTKVLGNATLGGVWSSLTPSIATVTSTGVVVGVSVGGTTIRYTVTDALTGCSNSANHIVTVNALPSITPIIGNNILCVGAITNLSNTTIGGSWSSNNLAIAIVDVNGVVSGVANGVTVINYTVNNITTGCQSISSTSVTVNALPVLGSINGANSVCVNSTTTLSNTTAGGNWISTNPTIATIDNAGVLTAIATGTTTIKYIVSNGSGCIDSVSKIITINDNPAVTAITASQSVCVGSNITASNITPNGVWTIGNNAFATIDASGLITGLADGVTFITYTVTDVITNCSAKISSPLIVNVPAVAPIIGVNALCPLSTSILTTATTGGVWSSTDQSVATVDANTGLVTAIANGVATITYKVPVGNACGDSASTLVTVNATLAIAPITGDSAVCKGLTSTLASATLGGIWSSSNAAVATIDATTGVVTTLSAGTSTITYSVTSGAGCSNSLSTTFTVDSLPEPVSFTVPASICKGAIVSLMPSVTGGIWNSSPNSIVFVDNAGNANGIAPGIATISYHITNTNGCSSDTLIKAVMVADLPNVATIAGANAVCLGSSITLTNDSIGGVWSSGNTNIFIVDANTGVVTPVAAGTASVNYTITSASSCATTVSKSLTVFDLPTVDPIVGGNSVCVGSSITLASPTNNGVWSSLTPFVASIDNSGVLTGNFSGGTTIKYTVTDAATTCSNFASLIVTVNALPIVPAITG